MVIVVSSSMITFDSCARILLYADLLLHMSTTSWRSLCDLCRRCSGTTLRRCIGSNVCCFVSVSEIFGCKSSQFLPF